MRVPRVLALALAGLASCADADAAGSRLSIAAAASLRELIEDSGPDFLAAREDDVELSFTFAGSSTLVRQIAAGAEIDVLVSADPRVLEHGGGRLDARAGRPVLGNRLALVAREHAPVVRTPEDLARVRGVIAVAAPSVPAGRYARELLAARGLAERLEARLVNADHVRAALALVESGAADYGLVYATDAALARRARTDWVGASDDGPTITYVAAAVRDARAPGLASAYLDFLAGEAFARRARALGFHVDG